MTSQPVPLKFQNSWSIKEKMTWTTREGWTMSTSALYFFFFKRLLPGWNNKTFNILRSYYFSEIKALPNGIIKSVV